MISRKIAYAVVELFFFGFDKINLRASLQNKSISTAIRYGDNNLDCVVST